jgi:hypothetical protein
MTFPRGYIGFTGLAFLGLGILFGLRPETANYIGIELPTASARNDVRAVYGGLELGIGLYLLWSLFRTEHLRAAIAFTIAGFACLAGVRGVSLLFDGPHDSTTYTLLATEVAWLVAGVAAWWALPLDDDESSSPASSEASRISQQ